LSDRVELDDVIELVGAATDEEDVEFLISIYPAGDVVRTYESVIASPDRAWLHGVDANGFLVSRWTRPYGERVIFLADAVASATIRCERWSSPEQVASPAPRLH
jgi:hypothetical protein